jgi:hypothetical protein
MRDVSFGDGPQAFCQSYEEILRRAGLGDLVELAAAFIFELQRKLMERQQLHHVKGEYADPSPERKGYQLYAFTHGMFAGRYSATGDSVFMLELGFHHDVEGVAIAA